MRPPCAKALILLLIMSGVAQSAVVHVDASASGKGNGSSWSDAYTNLSMALSAATAGDEVRVAAGIYRPSEIPGDRAATFTLGDGVSVYGGYAKGGSQAADWEANRTILSGDIESDDLDFDGDGDGITEHVDEIIGANSLHVVTVSGTSPSSILDGFVITAGSSYDPTCDFMTPQIHCAGGGILNVGGSPTLSRLWFSANSSGHGGGMANLGGSPTLSDVRFTRNRGSHGAGGVLNQKANPAFTRTSFESNLGVFGGAMQNRMGSQPLVHTSLFKGNIARHGGAVGNEDSSPVFEKVRFEENGNFGCCNWLGDGGALLNINSQPRLVDVVFVGNFVEARGGAIYNSAGSATVMERVRFDLNVATSGGSAIFNTGGSSLHVDNGIFRGNPNAMYSEGGGQVSMVNVVFTANGNFAIRGFSGTQLNMVNASIAGISPQAFCSAVYVLGKSTSLTISNSIIWSRGPEGSPGLCFQSTDVVDVGHSLIEGCKPAGVWNTACGSDGGGNLADADPMFFQNPNLSSPNSGLSGDLHLRDQSPARDVGDNSANPLLVDLKIAS